MTKKTVLIVDDEKNLAELIKYQLSAKGHYAVVALNGLEALETLKAIKPDLIILDMHMPVMDGIEFYTKIADDSGRPEYPVLVLTSRTEMEAVFKDIEVAGFMAKPFLIEELIKEVERILCGALKPVIFIMDFTDNVHVKNICEIFEMQQYNIMRIKDMQQLVELGMKQKPQCLIVEYGQQDASGGDLLKSIKTDLHLRDVPILAYSYSGQVDFSEQNLRGEVNKFLVAPESYEEFLNAFKAMQLE